jgi:myo-inositol-1(or 4)-monophosphatase
MISESESRKVEEIARDAGSVALQYFQGIKKNQLKTKTDGSPVSTADIETNSYICAALEKEFPSYGILSEESRGRSGKMLWVIDPIDATANFISGNSHFAVSIALCGDNGPVAGIVYAPAEKKLYSAQNGMGALLNGSSIVISNRKTLKGSKILLDIGAHAATIELHKEIASLLRKEGAEITSLSCASLDICAVGEGIYEARIHVRQQPWDIAAGMVVAEEAGAIVSQLNGEKKDFLKPGILVANSAMHPLLVALLKKVRNLSL